MVMHSVCECLSVSPAVPDVTFESIDLETSLLVHKYTFRISRLSLHIKVIGSRSKSREQNGHVNITKSTHTYSHCIKKVKKVDGV